MPTSGEPPFLVDTSVAVALVVEDHSAHERVLEALHGRSLGLADHALFETFSVLTRLPPPTRRSPTDVAALLSHNFPRTRFLDADATAELAAELANLGIAGGAVYDALVGTAARQQGLTLVTRDERALGTYRALDVDVLLVR